MCGIAGYINLHGKTDHNTAELSRMVDIQKHRGPDDFGMVGVCAKKGLARNLHPYEDGDENYDVMIGFDRLSIQDLSLKGHQPMLSPDGKVILSFNGEIYNANDYRQELIDDGVRFKSTTDTEVLLYLYLKYGIETTAGLLNGMFGICICDLRIMKMFLLRDRMGIKPLYYAFTDSRFAYASELKCFLALEDFRPKLKREAVTEHFTFYKPLDHVLLEGVEQVCPGEMLTVDLRNFSVTKSTFFDIDTYVRPQGAERTLDELKELTKEKLHKCTEKQKISDAKVGCQLSGGVDSSLVTYFAAQPGSNPLKDSISIIFDGEEKGFSEEPYINRVEDILGIEAHKKVIDVDYVIGNYERALWYADSVIGRPNSIGLMLLTQEARKYVTVLLSGEGSDELLGGYYMFTQGKEISRRLKSESEIVVETVKNQPETVHDFAEYAVISQQKTNSELCKSILPEYDAGEILEKRVEQFRSYHGTDFDRQIKYALKTYLPELLICQDKMSMANSIENRVPILDNEFIDFAFSIPEEYLVHEKNGDWQGKYLLKEVCADVFGEEFAYRRKMGFGLPYYRYFKDKRFEEYFYDVIAAGTKRRGILDAEVLKEWYYKLGNTSWGESELFWKACSLEAWCQMFLEGRDVITI